MKKSAPCALGLDYGTNTVRALIVRAEDGAEIGQGIAAYSHGENGVVLDSREPEFARQHPADYLDALRTAVRGALVEARERQAGFLPEHILGIGVDTTGSTPLPVDSLGRALAEGARFSRDANAYAWLWKDHTSTAEAGSITAAAAQEHPEYLAKCGGVYSSEWFWAKIWHCANVAPEVAAAADSWIELADWIPAILTGTETLPIRGICAAGHKGLYHESWGGFPEAGFLSRLHPELGRLRRTLGSSRCVTSDQPAGRLSAEWAGRLGLREGIPVASGALDAHLGAVGSGIAPGTLIKILGTSTCDIMVHPFSNGALPDIPGLCGIVPGSVLSGHFGLEAGQSAVGDLFNWFVSRCAPAGATHESLSSEAARLSSGESGLLALDWNNGNRTVLVDQRLTGLLVGQTLATRPADIYRALIEATAFGARVILERLHAYGVTVDRIVNCGGIAEKSPLVMQLYADVTGRPMHISRSTQTCALGSAITGAVVSGIYPSVVAAQKAMTGVQPTVYRPNASDVATYNQLFQLYKTLHDAFGLGRPASDIGRVMKDLLALRDEARTRRC
ncbi:MAG: ribulokinase [Pedosphaera sp.]|nr:ribulokinase [Pedosphaera sp.]